MKQLLKQLMDDLYRKNPNDLFDYYLDKFKEKIGINKYYIIHKNRILYRARKGCVDILGRHSELDIHFKMPYYKEKIGVPPALCASSGRFNRSGYAFLYLATNQKTCVAEINLEVGQICSIAKYKFVGESKYLNLCDVKDENVLVLKKFLLEPVYKENRYYYHYTQFIAEIIKKIGYHGIVFQSIQSNGINVVSFVNPDFYCIEFSEVLMKAKKINYQIEKVEEGYQNYTQYEKYLKYYNEFEEKEQKDLFRYLQNKINYEQNKK
ncbi:MAG: RES family NAD+ phosphorylase [Clostridia bacterium]